MREGLVSVACSSLLALSCAGAKAPEPSPFDTGDAHTAKRVHPVTRTDASGSPTAAVDAGMKEDNVTSSTPHGPASFDEDLAFLNAHSPEQQRPIVLSDADGAKVALSALYQGRVMTSAISGAGRSLGWINRPFIEAGKSGTHFDNYGGEDRFWLGPEGGQYGLYFPPGKPFTFDLWQTPHPMQEGAWDVAEAKPDHVVFKKSMTVTNWSSVPLTVNVERTARLLGRDDAKKILGLSAAPPKDVGFVAFETKNRIVNGGTAPWTKDKGVVSIWILAMFAPAADSKVVIPFETNAGKGTERTEIVNDRYFGKVPADRLSVHEDKGFLTFKCDGKERGKIGLAPGRAKSALGSYSAEAKLLTIVHYDGPKKGAPYVNSMWEQQKEPYKGDVVNSYNDGPPAPGKPPLGGFYEIETSSPAAELAPGKDLVHTHRTFHFVGEPDALEPIAKKVLGVSLSEIGK